MNADDHARANHAFAFGMPAILQPCVLEQGASLDEHLAKHVADRAIDWAARGKATQRPSEAALSMLAGERDVGRLIAVIAEGMAPADALHDGLEQIRAVGDPLRTTSAFRHLQKVLIERRA